MTTATDRPRYLTPAELAERWRVSVRHIRDMARDGRLRAIRVGAAWRIPAAELDRIEQQAQPAA